MPPNLIAHFTPSPDWTFYHGTPDERHWEHGSTRGIHVGTEEAARQALNARIGTPHEGQWDGTREYGKTLLNLDQVRHEFHPETRTWTKHVEHAEPDYPSGRATYSPDAEGHSAPIPMDARPSIFPVRITGPMINHPAVPVEDDYANARLKNHITRGNARRGYFYRNVGEDEGSISAAVPSAAHLERLDTPRTAGLLEHFAAAAPLYHGSLHPIEPGTVLTPGDRDPDGSIHSGDWVYATASPESARYFASMHDFSPLTDAPVHVHRVEPIGDIEPHNMPGEDERFAHGNYRAKALRVLDSRQVPSHYASLLAHFGAYYHGSDEEFRPGEMIEPGHESPRRDPGGKLIWMHQLSGEARSYGRHLYEVEPTGILYDDQGDGGIGSWSSTSPARVVRKIAADEGFPNPYHGTSRFGGRPEFSRTWFHGTRGAPEFGERKGRGDENRLRQPPEERSMSSGWSQPNQLLGVHFSPLHEVAHKFAGQVSSTPSALVHARLHFSNPAHYPSEHHLNIAMAHWAAQHYPHWHHDKLNASMAWNYRDTEGTHRDFSRVPDDYRQRYSLGEKAQSLLQWHPHLPEILKGFTAHLRSQGHRGITYGNDVEGPYETDAGRGGEAAQKYIRKTMEGWPRSSPKSISAIAQPEDIETTRVEHVSAWRQEPEPHERTWEDISDGDEDDEMRDRVLAYHRMHGGAYPRDERTAARQLPVSETGPLYHGTTEERAQRILEHGFEGATVHLTPHAELAPRYAEGRVQADGGGTPAVLRIEKVRGVSAHEVGYMNPDMARDAGADYQDKGPEVVVLNPAAIHGISKAGAFQDLEHQRYLQSVNEQTQRERALGPRPFYHGTPHEFQPGDLVHPGRIMDYAYAASSPEVAAHYGEHVYEVEFTAGHAPDPEDPHRPRASFMSDSPLRVVRKAGEGVLNEEGTQRSFRRTSALEASDYEGTTGDPSHITRGERGTIPTAAIAHLGGVRGEVPGEHRNRQGEQWEEFKRDIAEHGITSPLFITVDHGEEPKISEGSHRRDAAVELGLPEVPAEIRYFGHAERQGTVLERAMRRRAGLNGGDDWGYSDGFVTCGQGHEHWGPHGAAFLLLRHTDPEDGVKRYLLQKRTSTGATDHPGVWALPGGALHEGEDSYAGARREAREEMGPLPRTKLHHTVHDDHGGWFADTHVADVKDRFQPHGEASTGYEAEGHAWFAHDEIKDLPLHPGFAKTWDTVRRSRVDKEAVWDASGSERTGVYLRFGHWPKDERSYSSAGGYNEDGVSVYDLDKHGNPAIDHGLDRGHLHDEDCEPDCDLQRWDPDNDPRQEMQGRLAKAERNRYHGEDRPSETAHLVRGEMVSIGYDGEPLLRKVRRVGDWIDHRHLFFPGAERHRLARSEYDEDYEPPKRGPKTAKATRDKDQVNYRRATGHERCGTCSMIRVNPPDFESHSCTLVRGLIDPDDVCDEWDPAKEGKTAVAADPPLRLYHGARREFAPGELIEPGHEPNWPGASSPDHVYMTENLDSADVFSGLTGGHIYHVRPTGPIERDPEDLTYEQANDAEFGPGDRHYRTRHPLRVVREVTDEDYETHGEHTAGITGTTAPVPATVP